MTDGIMNGRKVSLRALEPEDVEILYRWENDSAIWHLSTTLAPLSRFTLEQYVINSGQDIYATRQLRLMVDLRKEGGGRVTIGSVDLFEFDPLHQRAGIGILVMEEYRGKGYASEAIDLVIRYAFETLQLHQVFCNISPENTESIGLFESKGFTRAGIKKDWNRVRNSWQDEVLYQLIQNHR
jgi:diamine N-acetyltransferase